MSYVVNSSLHHIGILTRDLVSASKCFQLFGYIQVSQPVSISSQRVSVAFLEKPSAPRLELVEPFDTTESLHRFLEHGDSPYHLAFEVDSIDSAADYLADKGFFSLARFNSEAFDGRLCVFMVNRSGLMFELIERA